jgi:N-sulfoglucosamine sulfohydrolase
MKDMTLTSRRGFLKGTSAAAAGLALSGCRHAGTSRPNILWLIAEDFCPDLGCYGNRTVHTPNLDRLAAEGVRFNNAFATAPVCSASRSAIATGMYQTSIGAHNHRSHRDDGYRLPEGVNVFTEYFRRAGYHTSNVRTAAPDVKGTGKTDFNFNVEKPFDGTDWNQRQAGQSFYAQVNFSETHRIFHRFDERPANPTALELPPFYPDHPAMRTDWAMYLDSAQHLDVKIGKVLARLEQEGLKDSTIIIFFGDNGQPMPRGKQFLYEGGIRVPLIAWFPERFRPQDAAPGSVRDDLVSLIDVTATSLALAGIEPPAHMQGQIILGPGARRRDHIIAARDRCDETVDRIRCVRTGRYKYIRNFYPERPYTQANVYKDTTYPPLQLMRQLEEAGKLTGAAAAFMGERRPAEELYDLEADPGELHNLADSADQQQTLDQHRGILDRWIKVTNDQGAIAESSIPEGDKNRIEIDGWCLAGSRTPIARAAGALRVVCQGKSNQLLRSYVAEGGDLAVRFRARSRNVLLRSFQWGTITALGGAPDMRAPVKFIADGEWRDYTVPFKVDGYLARLAFDFGEAEGSAEFDSIRLSRGAHLLAEWNF